jgi:hypothetical protein
MAAAANDKSFPDQYHSLGKDVYVIVGEFNDYPTISIRVCGYNGKRKAPYPKSEGKRAACPCVILIFCCCFAGINLMRAQYDAFAAEFASVVAKIEEAKGNGTVGVLTSVDVQYDVMMEVKRAGKIYGNGVYVVLKHGKKEQQMIALDEEQFRSLQTKAAEIETSVKLVEEFLRNTKVKPFAFLDDEAFFK